MSFPKIGAPATRALIAAGYTETSELSDVPDSELLALHGFGPKALALIRDHLGGTEQLESRAHSR
ncbi:DNA-binding protein [Actinomycetes bacterium M1A6_2h]